MRIFLVDLFSDREKDRRRSTKRKRRGRKRRLRYLHQGILYPEITCRMFHWSALQADSLRHHFLYRTLELQNITTIWSIASSRCWEIYRLRIDYTLYILLYICETQSSIRSLSFSFNIS